MKSSFLLRVRKASVVLACLLASFPASASHAAEDNPQELLITFDEPTYPTGDELKKAVHSQGTRWTGQDTFLITPEAGVEGSNGVVTSPTSENRWITFDPVQNELPGFDGNSSVVEISFQYRFPEEPQFDLQENAAASSIQLGYNSRNSAVRFGILKNGKLTYSDGPSQSILVLMENKRPYLTADVETWTKISAILDYSTKTYTFTVNDIALPGTYAFIDDQTQELVIRIINVGSEDGRHSSVVLDNFSVRLRKE